MVLNIVICWVNLAISLNASFEICVSNLQYSVLMAHCICKAAALMQQLSSTLCWLLLEKKWALAETSMKGVKYEGGLI